MSIHNEGIYAARGGKVEAGAMVAGAHGVASNVNNDSGALAELMQLTQALLLQLRSQAAELPNGPALVQTAEAAIAELRTESPRKPRLIEHFSTLMGGVASIGSLVDVVAKVQQLVLTIL